MPQCRAPTGIPCEGGGVPPKEEIVVVVVIILVIIMLILIVTVIGIVVGIELVIMTLRLIRQF